MKENHLNTFKLFVYSVYTSICLLTCAKSLDPIFLIFSKKNFIKNDLKNILSFFEKSDKGRDMLKPVQLFAILCILFAESLFAHTHPCPGGWAVDAEYLLLFPTIDDTYFVIESSSGVDFPNGSRNNNDFDFQSGFRVGGAYGFCDCDREFQGYYTRLRATESKTVNGDFLWAIIGRPDPVSLFEHYSGSASSDLDLLYQRADGFFTQKLLCCCGSSLYLQGGLEYAYIRLHEEINYRSALNTFDITKKSRTWGIGPELGLEFDYAICQISCCCPGTLSFVACTSGSILASKTRDEAQETLAGIATSNLDIEDRHTWRLIPAWHARVGLNYETCFSCFGASLEIGYEFNTYARALSRIIFPDDTADGLCFTNYYNFDVQGLYVAGTITF